MSIDKLKKESMMKKIVYTTCLLISLLFAGCGSLPENGWILAYTATSYGSGYKVYNGNFNGLAYTATSFGSGYKVYNGDFNGLAYTTTSFGGGYKVYNGDFDGLAYTITESGKIYRGDFEALVYKMVSYGSGYKIYAVSSPNNSSETESDKKTEDFPPRMIEI